MDRLSETQRIEILIILGYGDRMRNLQEVCNIFNDKYPNRNPITKSTVSKINKKFRETGKVKDAARSGRLKSATDGDKAHFARNVREYLNNIFFGRWIGRRGIFC